MVLHIIIIIGGSRDSGLSKALMESPSHSVQKPLCCDCCIICWVDQINKHLLINNQLRLHGHGIIFNPMHNGITWHNFTYISINISPFRAPRKLIRKRNFHKFNEIDFLAEAGQTLKNLMPLDNESVNGMAVNLETKISTLVNNHAPFKQIRVRPTRKPWITNELIKLISHRNRLFKKTRNDANNWTSYKEFINWVLSRIRQTKKQYYSQIINDGKPGDKWAVFNTLTNKHKTTNNIK